MLKRGEKTIEINGGNVVYEILGKEGDFIALTPGGRFSKDIPGLRAAGARRWSRAATGCCCGTGRTAASPTSSSTGRANPTCAPRRCTQLITGLDIGPCIIAGGSGGARDSMLTTMLYPEWSPSWWCGTSSAGCTARSSSAVHYIMPSILAVRGTRHEGTAAGPRMARAYRGESRQQGSGSSHFDEDEFLKVMLRWLNAFVSKPGQTIPGVADEMFDNITVPTLIIRGGENDWDHPSGRHWKSAA